MDESTTAVHAKFRRRPFGYAAADVDAYLEQAKAAYESTRREIERLQAVEPLARVSGEVAALITTFAETVASMRESAERDVAQIRLEAESYAEVARAEGDRVVATARVQAETAAKELIDLARAEIELLAEQRRAVERSLIDASSGVTAALGALGRLAGLPQTDVVLDASPDQRVGGSQAETSTGQRAATPADIELTDPPARPIYMTS